jgi:hypothetical protein
VGRQLGGQAGAAHTAQHLQKAGEHIKGGTCSARERQHMLQWTGWCG